MGTGNNTFYQQMISFHKWSGKTDKHGYLFPLVKKLVYKKKKILLEMGREKMAEAGKMGREIQLGGLPTIGKPPESHNTQEEIAKLNWYIRKRKYCWKWEEKRRLKLVE